MTTRGAGASDNRRAVLRAGTFEILKSLRAFSRLHEGDMFALLVFTTIWSANGEHLIGDERYTSLHTIGPDSTSAPITDEALQRAIGAPAAVVAGYVDKFIGLGVVERVSGGLIIPGAVFTLPDMMDAANEFYDRMLSLVASLRTVGFSFGRDA
jgi:hypothetical protein